MSSDAEKFRAGIGQLWGYGAQSRAARYFEVTDRTIRHWIAGTRSIPANVMAELHAMISIAPPDGETDRDAACQDALEPALSDLRDRAVGAGWHPAEVATAIMALAAAEILAHAGREGLADIMGQIDAVAG